VLNVSVGNLTFPLSLRRSVQTGAATYYSRSKKAEKKLEGAKKALQETQARIKRLREEQTENERENRAPPQKRRRKSWYEKFRWFHSSDGFLVIGGRDATTNEILIKKHMEPHDIVFHADIRGAPFVLIKTEGKAPPEPTLREAAQLAASYSRAWKEMFTALDVYWVSPQQVDKSPPTGQYLKKGSFRIHGSKNYVRNVPLKVAIAVKSEEEHLVVVSGPPQAISKQTETYVEVIPGEQKSGQLAKRIRRRLAEKASKTLKEQLRGVPIEEIQRSIPLGKGQIL
jgi:predicted ribosome quality control (RQC) complex YloA/Tae2 family protein